MYIYAHNIQYDARFRRISLNIEIILQVAIMWPQYPCYYLILST